MKKSQIQLTWNGFDAAVDLIVAQCNKKLSGVMGATSSGQMLAIPIAGRLGVPYLTEPKDKMLLVDGHAWNLALAQFAYKYEDVEVWVWVDSTPMGAYNAVFRLPSPELPCVAMPWQDAILDCAAEPFISGFHD